MEYFAPFKAFFNELCQKIELPKKEREELLEATKELVLNAIEHAYAPDEEGTIEIAIELFSNGIKVDVRDWGLPFDQKLLKSVPLDPSVRNKGLNRVYLLVDSFQYVNLGLGGKKFSIVKYVPWHLHLRNDVAFYSDIETQPDETLREHLKERLVVREYKAGDEVAISQLIYKNYGYTYFKDIFYFPEKIAKKEGKDIHSIVAEIEGRIVGHFALVMVPNSNTAEIGIAVVDPDFKGLGIMKAMFERLIQKAKELGLDALFGEAITFHPYSQKANARFGFCTSALQLGEVHQMVRLKGHKYPFRDRRGATVVEYKLFKKEPKSLFLPKRYKEIIQRTYQNCQIPIQDATQGMRENSLQMEYNKAFNIATIVVDGADEGFAKAFHGMFEEILKKHPDMVYVDINLESVEHIDEVVAKLREYEFFYCGVLFLRRRDNDYLRMQRELSENIEEQNIACYSDFCKELHRFILQDKRF